MPENDAVIEFVMDEPYFRESHREWIASRGVGWRIDRIMIPVFVVAALVVMGASLAMSANEFLYVAGGLLLIAVFEGWKYVRRARAWMSHCKTLPCYGKGMRIVLRGEISCRTTTTRAIPDSSALGRSS